MAGSRFGAHIRLWFFFVPVIVVFLMPALPDKALFEIPEAESQSLADTVGDERADEVVAGATGLFRRAFVNTGLLSATVNATRDDTISDGGMSDFAHQWVVNFWRLLFRVFYRAYVMKVWLLGTAAFCLAAFMDGSMRRKIRAAAAGCASPLSFHIAGHGILLVLGVAFAVLIAPVPVLAQYWVVVALVLGALLWKAAASYQ